MEVKSISDIAKYLDSLIIKKSVFGLKTADVWKVIDELNQMYKSLYLQQEIKYEAMKIERDNLLAMSKNLDRIDKMVQVNEGEK